MTENNKNEITSNNVDPSKQTFEIDSKSGGNFPAYMWLFPQETVLNVVKVKYGIGRITLITTQYTDENGRYTNTGTSIVKEKVKFKKMVLTNYRVAFLDSSDRLFKDKLKRKELKSPRWFLFYNMEGFNKYIEMISSNNKDVVKKLCSVNKRFKKQFIRYKGLIVKKSQRKLAVKRGYIPSVYMLRSAIPTTEDDFVKELAGTHSSFVHGVLDSMKHGFFLDSLEIDLNNLQVIRVSDDKEFSIMKKMLISYIKKKSPYSADGFFIRVAANQMDDFHNLIQRIQPMIQQVSTLLNDNNFINEIFMKYMRGLT